ncbi:MAG TPA: hypothetical protein VF841_03555 [Anaeromyxobacter sp.]
MTNRISAWLAASAVATLACGTVSQAPTPEMSPVSNSAPGRPSTSTSAAGATRPATNAVVGTLAQVGGGRLTVRSQDDRDAVIDLTDATRVTVDGRQATIADLQPGMDVRASCDTAWRVISVDASSTRAAPPP